MAVRFLPFVSFDGITEIYTSLATGSAGNVKVNGVLAAGDGVGSLAWAPDSTRVAWRVYVAAADVTELRTSLPTGSSGSATVSGVLVTGAHVRADYAWAPDGSRIAYRADQDTLGVNELYTSLPTGAAGNVRVNGAVAAGGFVASFAWAPDGSRIAYLAEQDTDNVTELYTSLPTGTGNVKVSGALVTGGNVAAFAWAPDSSRLAYTADQDTDNDTELYTSLPTGTGNIKISGPLVIGGDVFGTSMAWVPDSSRIVYSADQATDGVAELYMLYSTVPTGAFQVYRLSGVILPSAGSVVGFAVR